MNFTAREGGRLCAGVIEPLLLTAARILTFDRSRPLTNATGFFFENQGRLFLVSSRHVMFDRPSRHFPDSIEIELHVDADNMVRSTGFSIPLYRQGRSLWRAGQDSSGNIDVATIELDRDSLPAGVVYRAFSPAHLCRPGDPIEVGSSVLVVCFPLGFHDTLHHLPVVRQAGIASSFGLRFQGEGYFITDARTHRGASGAPVVMRITEPKQDQGDLPWFLLGVHSSRVDVGSRDRLIDEALGLNCAWYADILPGLTGS